MTLGETLRSLRKNGPRGEIPVRQSAKALGIPHPTIYDWESPRSRPEPEQLRKYLQHLDVPERVIAHVLHLRSLPIGADLALPDEAGVQDAA